MATRTRTASKATPAPATETAATLAAAVADVPAPEAPKPVSIPLATLWQALYDVPPSLDIQSDEGFSKALDTLAEAVSAIDAEVAVALSAWQARAAAVGAKVTQVTMADRIGVSQPTIQRALAAAPILTALASDLGAFTPDRSDIQRALMATRNVNAAQRRHYLDPEGKGMLTGKALADALVTLLDARKAKRGPFAEGAGKGKGAQPPKGPQPEAPAQGPEAPAQGPAGGSMQTGDPATVEVSMAARLTGLEGTVIGLTRVPVGTLSDSERARVRAAIVALEAWLG